MRVKTKGFVVAGLIARLIFFAILGIAIMGFGVLMLFGQVGDFEKTTAIIEEINPVGEGDMQVIVSYTVDGVEYGGELGYYSSSMMLGDEITIKYAPDAPWEISAASVGFIGYIMLAVGALFIFLGIRALSKGMKRIKEDKEQEETYREQNSELPESQQQFPADEEGTLYYFHYDKSFSKQGHVMENENKQVVYEGVIKEFKLVGDFEMDFINHISGHTETHFVGHTVTSRTGHVTTSSGFDFDGKFVWDYLRERGLHFELILDRHLTGVNYEVTQYGLPFAHFVSSGANLYGEEKKGLAKVSNLSAPGLFRIYSFGDDLDLLFLIGVALARSSTN